MFPNLLFYIVHFVLICSYSTSAPVAHALTLPVVWRGLWRTQSQWRMAWSHGKFGRLPVALLSIYIKFPPPGLLRCRHPASFRRSGGLAAARCVVFPSLLSRNPAAWFGRGLAIFYTAWRPGLRNLIYHQFNYLLKIMEIVFTSPGSLDKF